MTSFFKNRTFTISEIVSAHGSYDVIKIKERLWLGVWLWQQQKKKRDMGKINLSAYSKIFEELEL